MAASGYMGGFGDGLADGLVLKHDNGANHISEGFQSEMRSSESRGLEFFPASATGQRRGGVVHPDT